MAKDNSTFFSKKNSWSEIKDRLLGGYLPQYFQKVLMTNKPIFYVDCFAGKGKFDDGRDGSPRTALKIRADSIGRTKSQNGKIDSCFIDLHYADELATNISDFCNCNENPMIISGKYEEVIESLLSDKVGKNIFLYIDPYGIKALDNGLFCKFSNYGFHSIEMLINMNSFGFFRDACRVMSVDYNNDEAFNSLDDIVEYEPTEVDASQQSKTLLNAIAGGDYWQEIVKDYKSGKINGYNAEKRFSTEYKQRLRKNFKYVLDMPIRMKGGQRPKYRMIHVSNHEQGCILMADNMASRSDELFIDIQNNGQTALFDSTLENVIIDSNVIQTNMSLFLTNFPEGITADKLIAAFFTEYGVLCKPTIIRSIWHDMEKAGTIIVKRIPATTPTTGKPSSFFTEDKSNRQSVTIRRRL